MPMRQHYCVPSRRLAGYLSAEVARRKFIIACLRLAGLGGLPAGRTRAQLLPWSCRGNVAQVLSVKNVRRYTFEYYGIGYFTRSQGGLGCRGGHGVYWQFTQGAVFGFMEKGSETCR